MITPLLSQYEHALMENLLNSNHCDFYEAELKSCSFQFYPRLEFFGDVSSNLEVICVCAEEKRDKKKTQIKFTFTC